MNTLSPKYPESFKLLLDNTDGLVRLAVFDLDVTKAHEPLGRQKDPRYVYIYNTKYIYHATFKKTLSNLSPISHDNGNRRRGD